MSKAKELIAQLTETTGYVIPHKRWRANVPDVLILAEKYGVRSFKLMARQDDDAVWLKGSHRDIQTIMNGLAREGFNYDMADGKTILIYGD